jgi:hypothetical protein
MPIVNTRPYQCDGPNCEALTDRKPKTQYPAHWMRASLRSLNGLTETGAFHDPKCALGWVRERLIADGVDVGLEPADEIAAKLAAADVEDD